MVHLFAKNMLLQWHLEEFGKPCGSGHNLAACWPRSGPTKYHLSVGHRLSKIRKAIFSSQFAQHNIQKN
jgi:hypothetical protein